MSPFLLLTAPETASMPDTGWRTGNFGALLFRATDRCVREKLRVVHSAGFPAVSEAQLTLFHHLDLDGARLTALAARATLTKQSMIELVDRAEAMGLVERRPDPADRRAKAVHPTADGLRLLVALRDGVVAADRGVGEVFGATFLAEARRRLHAYAPDWAGEHENMGRLFATAARRFSREALAVAHDRGWRSVGEVSLALFRNLDLEGARLTDVALRARMTKQSMRELVDRAETMALVARRSDPADRRAKVIHFTPAGLAMLDDVRAGLSLAEERFGQEAGTAFSARLKGRLLAYAAGAR